MVLWNTGGRVAHVVIRVYSREVLTQSLGVRKNRAFFVLGA